MALLPLEHPIPQGFSAERFTVRPITVHDVVRDFAAVTASAHDLRGRFPLWGWPAHDLTLEDHLVDLAWHQREAQLRRSFAYAVLDAAAPDRMLGCVYVDPPGKAGADADVCFWIRSDEPDRALLARLVERDVRRWIADEWPFPHVRWPGIDLTWSAYDALPQGAKLAV